MGKEKQRAVCGSSSNAGISSIKRDLHPKQFSFAQWCIFYRYFKEVINCTDKCSSGFETSLMANRAPSFLSQRLGSGLSFQVSLFLSVSSIWPLLYIMISLLLFILKKRCVTNYNTSSIMSSQRVSQCNIYHVVSGVFAVRFRPTDCFL